MLFRSFTGIPNGVKRVTINFYNLTKSGTTYSFGARLGSGSLTTSGYFSIGTYAVNTVGNQQGTDRFTTPFTGSNTIDSGSFVFCHMGSNLWIGNHTLAAHSGSTYYTGVGSGYVTLSGVLDRVALTYDSDTFTGGSVNCFYE